MSGIKTLWARELRAAMRERNLVIYCVLVPLALYPLMIWVFLTGMSFVEGQVDDKTSRVAVVAADEATAARIADAVRDGEDKVEVETATGEATSALQRLKADELDAVVIVESSGGASGNVAIALHYDGSDDLSDGARKRVRKRLREYRTTWLEAEATRLAISPEAWKQFEIVDENVASGRDMGGFILGLLAPATMLVMIAIGTLYPAIDTIAGERERTTWETSLTLGVSRRSLMIAKYLYVATMGTIAGLLNLVGITAAMAILVNSALMGDADVTVRLPLTAVPILLVGTFLLALVVAAMCMAIVPFARTFKEGQSLASPMFMLVMVPVFVIDMPIETVGLEMAAVPIANVMLLFKMAIGGAFRPAFAALAVASTGAMIAACVWLGTRVMKNEKLMVGVFEESPLQLLKRMFKPGEGK